MPTPPPIPIPAAADADLDPDPTRAWSPEDSEGDAVLEAAYAEAFGAAAAHAAAAAASARAAERAMAASRARTPPTIPATVSARIRLRVRVRVSATSTTRFASWRRGWRRTIEAPAGTRRNTTSSPPRESNANISWTRRTTKTIRLRRENSARGIAAPATDSMTTMATTSRTRPSRGFANARGGTRGGSRRALSRARSRAGRERAFPSETGEDRRPALLDPTVVPVSGSRTPAPRRRESRRRARIPTGRRARARVGESTRGRGPRRIPVRAVRAGRRRRRGGRVEKTRRRRRRRRERRRGDIFGRAARAPNESDARDEDVLGESLGSGRTRAVSCVAFARARATTDARDAARDSAFIASVLAGLPGVDPGDDRVVCAVAAVAR